MPLDYISLLPAIHGLRDALTSCQRAVPTKLLKNATLGWRFAFLDHKKATPGGGSGTR